MGEASHPISPIFHPLWPQKGQRMGQPIPRRNLTSWPLSSSSVFLENNFVPLVTQLPTLCPLNLTNDHMKRKLLLSVSLLSRSSFQLASILGPSISPFRSNASQGVWKGGKSGPQLQVSSTNDDIADRSWILHFIGVCAVYTPELGQKVHLLHREALEGSSRITRDRRGK